MTSTEAPAAPLVSVYDGRACVGFIFNRGPAGFEAFDADDSSLGLFPSQSAAAARLMREPAP